MGEHPRNVAGDFYVEHECCASCGVPWAIAPTLFDHDKSGCWVSRQPVGPDDEADMLEVFAVQELGCIRYGGTEGRIIRALVDMGEGTSVDVLQGRPAPTWQTPAGAHDAGVPSVQLRFLEAAGDPKDAAAVGRRAWAMAWPPAAVLALHAVLARIFGHQTALDPVFHLLGGLAGAITLSRLLDAWPALARRLPWDRRLVIAVVMVGVTLSWELAEFAADRTQGTSSQRGPLDTWSDVALGCLGAAAALAVDTRRRPS